MKAVQKLRIAECTYPIHKFECPCCGEEFESENDATLEEFSESLYKQGVRFKSMKYMSGVLCRDCWSNPEVQNSTL